ncbi:MAG: PIG-L deacetylase family protein [Pseudomonadota bacterium]
MINLKFDNTKPLKILALGAHCDDIEIGCGATIIKLLEQHPDAEIYWIVFSSNAVRKTEANNSALDYLRGHKLQHIEINDFRNGFFPYIASDIKEYFETIKQKLNPDIIFTHYTKDKHQDHRTISELTWNTFRNHMILEYEIAKYDGDLSTPNFYSILSQNLASRKITKLMEHYSSQLEKHWFSEDLFYSLMRLRGIESATEYAEGFHVMKSTF